jgi:hypothetical protein
MSSRQTRRTPHNVYTQKHADQQFLDFVNYSKTKDLPIPHVASSSKRSHDSHATDDNHPNAAKIQKLALGLVNFTFLLLWPSLILFVSSLLRIQLAQIRMQAKPFPMPVSTTTQLVTRFQMETNTPHFPLST